MTTAVVEGAIPTTAQVRGRIERAGDSEVRDALRYEFLICGRVSEVVGEKSEKDVSPANGPKAEDAVGVIWKDKGRQEKAWVCTVKTSKHGGMIRKPAVPYDFEPWAPALKSRFNSSPLGEPVFRMNRFNLADYVQDNGVFEGFVWRLEDYEVWADGIHRVLPDKKDGKGKIPVPGHLVSFSLHRLRDARAMDLTGYYGFDGYDLAVHGGWKVSRTIPGVSPVMSKYMVPIYEDWKRPFPKLLKAVGP